MAGIQVPLPQDRGAKYFGNAHWDIAGLPPLRADPKGQTAPIAVEIKFSQDSTTWQRHILTWRSKHLIGTRRKSPKECIDLQNGNAQKGTLGKLHLVIEQIQFILRGVPPVAIERYSQDSTTQLPSFHISFHRQMDGIHPRSAPDRAKFSYGNAK